MPASLTRPLLVDPGFISDVTPMCIYRELNKKKKMLWALNGLSTRDLHHKSARNISDLDFLSIEPS